jgi:hypothetical protein
MKVQITTSTPSAIDHVSSCLPTQQSVLWPNEQGTEYLVQVNWTGPKSRLGLSQSVIEWLGHIDVAQLPVDVAVGLIVNYLWRLIDSRRRPESQLGDRKEAELIALPSPDLRGIQSARIVLSTEKRRVEIDPASVDYHTVQILVGSCFDDSNPVSSLDRRDS